jgi:hypothetical protein
VTVKIIRIGFADDKSVMPSELIITSLTQAQSLSAALLTQMLDVSNCKTAPI